MLWMDEKKNSTFIKMMETEWQREKKGKAHSPKHTTSSVKYCGGTVMAWACTVWQPVKLAHGHLLMIFSTDGTKQMNAEAVRSIMWTGKK